MARAGNSGLSAVDWLPLLTGETCLCRGRRGGTFVIRSHDSPPPHQPNRLQTDGAPAAPLHKN